MIAVTLLKPKYLPYWLVPVLGAVVLVAFDFINIENVWNGLTSDAAINPLKILVLFISMTILSIYLDETGFFKWLANAVLKKTGTGKNQLKLFTAFFITIICVTIFTSNDVDILVFTPFFCYFCKHAKCDPIPYLISGFIAANTCSMLFIFGNPTNIYLATANNISFFKYLSVMWLPTLFSIITAYVVCILIFRKKLLMPIQAEPENVKIKNKFLFIISFVLLFLCIVLCSVSDYIGFEMWYIAFGFAVALILVVSTYCIIKREKHAYLKASFARAPWELIPFLISMFVLVLTLEQYGVTTKLANIFGSSNTILIYGVVSVLFANLINNIPMSVLFTSIIISASPQILTAGVYATVIGSNIGAFLTPVGALAGIMWLAILKKNDIKFSFLQFVKYGFIISVPVLASALFGLWVALL